MELRYTAIVIGKREVGETDRLYTFMTREGGKIRAKAIGVRKAEAKLASSLETLTLSDITIVRGRGIGRIAGAIAEETYPNLRSDLDTLSQALEAVRIFDSLVGLEEPDQAMFELLHEYLTLLDGLAETGGQSAASLLSEAFYVKLASGLGYHLETSVCAVSGERLSSGAGCFFSPDAGGVVLEAHADRYSVAISENAVKILRIFLANRLSAIRKVRMDKRDVDELSRIRAIFFRHIRR